MEQPAPSPAPTLDDHFPGFYPPTPSVDEPAVDPTPAVSADHAALEHEAEANKHRLEGAGVALLGAAAGFVVGGPLGAAVGGGLAGLSAVEHQGITEMALADEPKHHSSTTTSTTAAAPAAVQLDTHEAFGTPAVEKEQAELAHSPAQQLLNNDNDDGHHLGEALFAGAAGAKLASNEVEEPSTTAGTKQAAVPPVSESQRTTPTATTPNFGTPAIEKSQAELAHSPAQRLLAESASSTSAATPPLSAEAALLGAAAAGATSVGKVENEIEEPATVPVDEAVEKDLQAGAGIPTHSTGPSGNEILTATPLDDENEPSDRPSLPTPSGSLDSFSGAVLAAGSGVETPTIAPGPAASGFGAREPGTILLTDRDIEPADGPRESSNETPLAAAASVPLPVDTPSARSDVSIAGSDETETPRERNPFHLGEAAPLAAGGAALGGAAALAGPEPLDEDAPKDFEPYPPPTLPEHVETPTSSEIDTSSLSKLDEAPMFTAQDKGKGKAVDEALAVAAAGGGGVAMAVGMKSFSNDSPAETAPRTSSTFTENFDTPPVSATMAPAPLWEQRAELPSTAAAEEGLQHGEPRRAVDPRELAAAAGPATSPEQAGFVGVAPGVEPTPAMQEFAHLPQPAPNAQQEALGASDPATAHEQRSNAVPFAAAAGLAGAGAGAAGATMLARQSSGAAASTPSRAPAPAPVSRFREDAAAYTPSSPAAAENTTPSSTRAVMGSPAPAMPQQQQQQQMSPSPVAPPQQQQGAIPPHLAAQQPPNEAAATIERSPHMRITTAVVDGHKRLHRKSLSKGSPRSSQFSTTELERPGSVAGSNDLASLAPGQQQQPMQPMQPMQPQHPVQPAVHPQARFAVPPQQQQQAPVPSNAAMSGPTGFAGARPNVPAGDVEARRDRMMDSMVGVRDPLVSGPVVGATAPVRPPSMGTTSPTASSPSSPLAPPHPNRMESDSSGVGQRHNETHAGAPPTALGVTAVTAAAIPGMGTLPPVGGMPIPPHHQQQQHQGERSGPGVAPPSAIAPVEHTSGVQRKLSKRNPHEPGVDKERKEGFFHKIFGGGGGSRHSRNASAGSRNSANASPRASADIPRQ